MAPFLASVIQLSSTSDAEENWRAACALIERAASYGARFVLTPENTNYLGPHEQKAKRAESLDGETCTRFAALAQKHELYLLLGSFNEASAEEGKCFNTSVLFAPNGARLAVYRKRHLFDVDLNDAVRFFESETVVAGTEVVTSDTPLGHIGFSICYDLRFPEHYQALRAAGATLLTAPSAFTMTTGRAHWDSLTRARAIETQSWLLAPAQCGAHDDDGLRESYGHARIVDPWGQVVAEASDGPGIALAEIDEMRALDVRQSMPVWEHRRS